MYQVLTTFSQKNGGADFPVISFMPESDPGLLGFVGFGRQVLTATQVYSHIVATANICPEPFVTRTEIDE